MQKVVGNITNLYYKKDTQSHSQQEIKRLVDCQAEAEFRAFTLQRLEAYKQKLSHQPSITRFQ